jgi:ketosteroid isomerase-like protein
MGSEGVGLVRRVYRAWQEGDVEELLALVDPQRQRERRRQDC